MTLEISIHLGVGEAVDFVEFELSHIKIHVFFIVFHPDGRNDEKEIAVGL
jgi:hypothetical protein